MAISRNDPIIKEAENLIRKAIDDRVRPLEQKVEALERQLADLVRKVGRGG